MKNFVKKNVFPLLMIFITTTAFASPKKNRTNSIVNGFSEIAEKLLQTRADGKKPSYAFVALTSDDGNVIAEDYVTDALTEAVFNTAKIKIYERANLEKVLDEQKFQASGLVDEDTAKDIGKIVGVDYICYGTLKNVGDSITINVRVVDVQNGEICAMSRATVEKDAYLKNVKYQARKTSSNKQNVKASAQSQKEAINNIKRKAAKSAWTVNKVRNEFDEETIYSMKCMNPDGSFLFFGYEKSDKPLNSRVRCSISWNVFQASWKEFDFKVDSGNIEKISQVRTTVFYWDNKQGLNYENFSDSIAKIYFSDVATSKKLFKMFAENDIIFVRDTKQVRPFQTEGFLEVLAVNGISVEEINTAFSNESF